MKKLFDIIHRINWTQIPPATYVRYILMIIAVLNVILTRLGWNPIDVSENELYQLVSDVLGVVILVVNTWFNNSVTQEALDADTYRKEQLVSQNTTADN